jgi:hypothetical protein
MLRLLPIKVKGEESCVAIRNETKARGDLLNNLARDRQTVRSLKVWRTKQSRLLKKPGWSFQAFRLYSDSNLLLYSISDSLSCLLLNNICIL